MSTRTPGQGDRPLRPGGRDDVASPVVLSVLIGAFVAVAVTNVLIASRDRLVWPWVAAALSSAAALGLVALYRAAAARPPSGPGDGGHLPTVVPVPPPRRPTDPEPATASSSVSGAAGSRQDVLGDTAEH